MTETHTNIFTFTAHPEWARLSPFYPLERLRVSGLIEEGEELDEALALIRGQGWRKPSWTRSSAGRAGSQFFSPSKGKWADCLQLVGTAQDWSVYQDPVVPDTLWVFRTGGKAEGRMPWAEFKICEEEECACGALFMRLPFIEGGKHWERVSMV